MTLRLTRLEDLCRELQALATPTPRALFLLDGHGGAGKSTLARSLLAQLEGLTLVELDSFYFPRAEQVPEGVPIDTGRLLDEVVTPFRDGAEELVYRTYNWGYLAGLPDGLSAEPQRVDAGSMLLIEGQGSFTAPLPDSADCSIWLDVPVELCLERGLRRDIDEYGIDPEVARRAWAAWGDSERARDREALAATADIWLELGES